MQKSVLNKQRKFGVKILWHYADMAIFVLRCFILTHPVCIVHNSNPLQGLLLHDAVFDELEERWCVFHVGEAEHFTGVMVARCGRWPSACVKSHRRDLNHTTLTHYLLAGFYEIFDGVGHEPYGANIKPARLYPAICFRGSMKLSEGTIEWPKATSRGAKRRAGEGSAGLGSWCPPPQVWPPGKFWKLRRNLVQSGVLWQEIDGSPVFHLCERLNENIAIMLDSGIDIVVLLQGE